MAEFDFKELVAKAHFDHVGPAFPTWWKNNKTLFVLPSLKNLLRKNQNQPYFMQVSFSYKGEEFTLPNEPLVSINLVKTIVETPTIGRFRKGTVKEYINTEDYYVSIRGVCVGENQEAYPYDQVDKLNKLMSINHALDIVSNPFFDLFGIEKLVLKELHFDEMLGKPGLQGYVINAVSDQPFFAELKEQDGVIKKV